jgi:hypothetical protein
MSNKKESRIDPTLDLSAATETNINISSHVNVNDLQPYIQLTVGMSFVKLAPAHALILASNIQAKAHEAVMYSFVTAFLHKSVYAEGGVPDLDLIREVIAELTMFKDRLMKGETITEIVKPRIVVPPVIM